MGPAFGAAPLPASPSEARGNPNRQAPVGSPSLARLLANEAADEALGQRLDEATLTAWSKAAEGLFTSPYGARGDADGLLGHWLAHGGRHLDTPVAPLAVRLALAGSATVWSTGDWGTQDALRLLANCSEWPGVEELLLRFHIRGYERTGRRDLADAIRQAHAARGYVPFAWQAGPYGDGERSDYYVAWPPEREPRAGETTWRPLRLDPDGGFVPWRGLFPRDGRAAYALARVEVPEGLAGPAWLEAFATGSFLVAVDGDAVLSVDRLAVEQPRQTGRRLVLTPGSHWILLKVARDPLPQEPDSDTLWRAKRRPSPLALAGMGDLRESSAPSAWLRLLGLDGRPLKGLIWADSGTSPDPVDWRPPVGGLRDATRDDGGVAALKPSGRPDMDLWRAAAKKHPNDAAIQAAAALSARLQDCPEAAWRHAAEAARLLPEQPAYAALAGDAAREHYRRPAAWRRREAAARYAKALSLQSGHVPALLGLAWLEAERGDWVAVERYAGQALTVNDACLEARGLLVGAAFARDRRSVVRGELAALEKNFPVAPLTAEWLARTGLAWGDAGLVARALAVSRPAGATASTDTATGLLRRSWYYGDTGRLREAEAVLGGAAPGSFAGAELALAAMARSVWGDMPGALRTWEEALARSHGRAGWWRAAGDDRWREGDIAGALEAWRGSLARNPGQHDLRRLVWRSEGKPFDYRAGRAIDWRGPAEEARSPNAGEAGEGKTAALTLREQARLMKAAGTTVRLVDQAVVTLWSDGSGFRHVHEVDEALTPVGADKLTRWPFRGEVLEAATTLPEGPTLEPMPRKGGNVLVFPGMRAGAVREGRFLEAFAAPEPGFGHLPIWYFRHPSREEAFVWSEYVIRAPERYPLVFAERGLGADIARETVRDGRFVTYRWLARNQLPPPLEPGAADPSEWLPHVAAGRAATWAEVARAGADEWLGRMTITRDLVDAARRILGRDAPTPPASRSAQLAEIAALHGWVCREVNALPLDLPASRVLHERSGDRNLLLVALLRAAGYDADPAAARPGPGLMAEPHWTLPQLEYFPLRLVAVTPPEGGRRWLDTRYAAAGVDDLPEDLAGATALILAPGEATVSRLPEPPWEAFAGRFVARMAFPDRFPGDDAGDAAEPVRVTGEWTRRGAAGLRRKGELRGAALEKRLDLAEAALTRIFPGFRAQEGRWDGADNPGMTCTEAFVGEWPREGLGQPPAGGKRACRLAFPALEVAGDDALRLATRRSPFHLRRPVIGSDRLTVRLPVGARLTHLPDDLTLAGRFGSYQLRVRRVDERTVEAAREYVFRPQRVWPEDWPEFSTAFRRIALAEAERIEWE